MVNRALRFRKQYRRTVKRSNRKQQWKARMALVATKPSLGNIIGKRILARHKVSRTFTLNPTAGGIAIQTVRATYGIDDPWGDASESVRGYDQLNDLYRNFQVIGSKIRVRFFVEKGATVTPTVGVLFAYLTTQTSTTNLTTIDDYKENQFSRMRVLKVGDQSGAVTLSHFYSPKKMAGRKLEIGDTGQQLGFFRVFAFPTNEIADPGDIYVQMDVEYLTVWNQPDQVPAS